MILCSSCLTVGDNMHGKSTRMFLDDLDDDLWWSDGQKIKNFTCGLCRNHDEDPFDIVAASDGQCRDASALHPLLNDNIKRMNKKSKIIKDLFKYNVLSQRERAVTCVRRKRFCIGFLLQLLGGIIE